MNKNLLSWWAQRGVKSKIALLALAAISLFNSRAYALVMRENGPEPIIVQIKESLRTSDDLDTRLNQLATRRQQERLTVEKWWAGSKLLVMLSFHPETSQEQALAIIARLQQSPAVEKVIALSAYNLEFQSGDFAREYGPNAAIPDAARRGFDAERIGKPEPRAPDAVALLQVPHVPGRLIVRWKEEHVWNSERTGFNGRRAAFHRESGCRVVHEVRSSALQLIDILEFDDATAFGLAEKLKRYMDSGLVVYAQPDYIYTAFATPNDPVYSGYPGPQWSLPIISAPQAWDITTGNPSVKIAVADSGANVSHPDFIGNLASGHYNFIGNNTNVTDDTGHGSHVASILGARGNNAFVQGSNGGYMTGVAWNVSMLIVKVLNIQGGASGSGTSSSIVRGINYASDPSRGVTAINLSLGYYYQLCLEPPICEPALDQAVFDALRLARNRNVLAVCAAGNSAVNNDDQPLTPAGVPTDNIIAVAATTRADTLAAYSGYGASTVDLAAPGGASTGIASEEIIGLRPFAASGANSSLNPASYKYGWGTSSAAPHVSGAVALVKSRYPWENYLGVRDRILMGTDKTGALNGLCRTNGRLNLQKALQTRSMMNNLSTRARVEGGDRKMIGGFTIGSASATGTLKLAILGKGPTVGVSSRLANPMLTLNNSTGAAIRVQYDSGPADYADPNERAQLQAYGLLPSDSREAAMLVELPPGAYTLFVDSQDGQFGIGLFEIYELEGNADERARLVNLSTRCLVGTGDNVAIAGMIVGGGVDSSLKPDRRVLIKGSGPSLPSSVGARIGNPALWLPHSNEENDNWQTLPAGTDELIEAGLQPTNGLESALWPTFRPGAYTVVLRPADGSTGVGLLELFEY